MIFLRFSDLSLLEIQDYIRHLSEASSRIDNRADIFTLDVQSVESEVDLNEPLLYECSVGDQLAGNSAYTKAIKVNEFK